jgi:hypothetical protein
MSPPATPAFTLDRQRFANVLTELYGEPSGIDPAEDETLSQGLARRFMQARRGDAIRGAQDVLVQIDALTEGARILLREPNTTTAAPARVLGTWVLELQNLLPNPQDRSFDGCCTAVERLLAAASDLLPHLRVLQAAEGEDRAIVYRGGPAAIDADALHHLSVGETPAREQLDRHLQALQDHGPEEWLPGAVGTVGAIATLLLTHGAIKAPDRVQIDVYGYDSADAMVLHISSGPARIITSEEIDCQQAVGLTLPQLAQLLLNAINRALGLRQPAVIDAVLARLRTDPDGQPDADGVFFDQIAAAAGDADDGERALTELLQLGAITPSPSLPGRYRLAAESAQ